MTDLLTSPAAIRRDIERFRSFAEELRDHVSDLQDTLDEVLERETADEVADLKWQLQETQRDLQRLREENANQAAEVAILQGPDGITVPFADLLTLIQIPECRVEVLRLIANYSKVGGTE